MEEPVPAVELSEAPPPAPVPEVAETVEGEPPPLAGDDILSACARIEEAINEGFKALQQQILDKLTCDRFKEEQIDRLHEELQAHRSDALSKPLRQLLLGLVRLHDDLGRTAAALQERPADELTPERFFRHLADFQDDVELLLGQNGVERFEAPGEAFDPHRQTAVKTVPAEPALTGRIALRLRPGFDQGDKLLQKERVAVYVASDPSNHPAQGDLP
jgi:molecular chaperone GrpE